MGVILYKMMMGELPFKGKNFEEVKNKTLSGNFLVLYFLLLECQKLLTKIPAKDIMKDHWLNMGQEEGLRLYGKLCWGDMGPNVTKIIKNIRFKQHKI